LFAIDIFCRLKNPLNFNFFLTIKLKEIIFRDTFDNIPATEDIKTSNSIPDF